MTDQMPPFDGIVAEGQLFDDLETKKKECRCSPIPSSAFGAAIFCFLFYRSIDLGVYQFITSCLIFLTQGVVLIYLWGSLPTVQESQFCTTPSAFMLALIATFLLYLVPTFSDVFVEILVFIYSKEIYFVVDQQQYKKMEVFRDGSIRKAMLVFLILQEACIGAGTLVVGVNYIVTSEGPSNLIQATLAIVFVSEIDNIAHTFLQSPLIQKQLKSALFKIDPLVTDEDVQHSMTSHTDWKTWHALQRYFYILNLSSYLLVSISVGIVFTIRTLCCS